jgi:outer membrane protein, multidrug efflux system
MVFNEASGRPEDRDADCSSLDEKQQCLSLPLPILSDVTSPPRATIASSCCLLSLLAACASTAPITAPPDVPAAFEQPAGDLGGAGPQSAAEWFHGFGSVELDELIKMASAGNLDLVAAAARVAQADARSRAAGAGLLPQVDVGANVAHFRGRANGVSASETDWSALASARYEADFWGKNRATANSAAALARASRADRETVALTVLGGTANSYFQVLSLRQQLAIARSNLDTARDVLKVIEARYNVGAAGAVELATQRATVAATELAIPVLTQQEVAARGALAILLGRAPEQFTVEGTPLEAVKEPAITAGLPAALLTRRPDLFSAEASLQAANADVLAARAALLPAITLTASGGVQNPAVQAAVETLTGTGGTLVLGASIVQTIFDAGRRRAARAETEARRQELLANYRASVLAALLDVETALSSIASLNAQQSAQLENMSQSEHALEGARLRYQAGSGDYLNVLEAQRLLYAAREQHSIYQLARLQALVGLCRALGGGWQSAQN